MQNKNKNTGTLEPTERAPMLKAETVWAAKQNSIGLYITQSVKINGHSLYWLQ